MTLTRTCEHCDGEGDVWVGRRGPNDPDGHMVICGRCVSAVACEGFRCQEPATEMVAFEDGKVEPYCSKCAMQARIDAGMVE